ncbi:MAG: tetratricopeptide repeat protein, partial [Flammeovirgaceae bacterium]|nr:tetratricopeptide repeat protein [Flammeovirgaceae bacterium]
RGNVYSKTGRYEKAIEDYTVAMTYWPDYAAAYYNRAIVYYKLKKLTEACNDIRTAESKGMNVENLKAEVCK